MITMKDIIREGHEALVKVADEVELPLSQTDKDTLIKMREFLINSQNPAIAQELSLRPGVGIAAPQINLSKRMFVIRAVDVDNILHSMCIINPIIIKKSLAFTYLPDGEGCLSVDRKIEGITPRHESITFHAHLFDPQADLVIPIEMELNGYLSIVFQHEFDHLNGVLFFTKTFLTAPYAHPLYTEDE